jgi:sodium-dependent dicarboxylate transporter 2/3/5
MKARLALLVVGLAVLLATAVGTPPQGLSAEGYVALGLLVVMALWWFTEALPVTATALLPFVVLPLAGAGAIADVASSYMAPVLFLVLGGALLALAMEKSGLHRRVALAVVSRAGTNPRRLVLAFMGATAFVSMWVSNTASALIMMPIATSVLAAVLPARPAPGTRPPDFAAALVLGVAYAATIGGLGTLIGSPTNAIAAGIIERTLGLRIGFLEWALVGVPLVVVSIPVSWWLLTRLVFRSMPPEFDRAALVAAIGERPALTSGERRLLPILGAAVIGWIALPWLRTLPGLATLDDATIAIVAALALFVVPAGTRAGTASGDRTATLLEWSDTARAPWDVLVLFGGGLALAEAITATGLGDWIGTQLAGLGALPIALTMLGIVLTVIFVTEFASNVAAAASFIPIVAGLAGAIDAPALLLVLPAAFAATWGFMVPSGTPPNAIAYATGYVRVRDMVRAGFWIDLLGLALIPVLCLLAVRILG